MDQNLKFKKQRESEMEYNLKFKKQHERENGIQFDV